MNQQGRASCAILTILLFTLHIHCEETEIVKTESGELVGKIVQSRENIPVAAYYGIPYAETPVGKLRFAPPVKKNPWTGTFDASNSETTKTACLQHYMEETPKTLIESTSTEKSLGTEDCLILHVFAPHPKPENAPVVVYIHGGSFIAGTSTWWVDHTVLASQGFVTVAMNYRLAVFGFFNLGNNEAPGNLGLLDQQLAMQWARENVAAFGGDSSKITLWGASAGSASVGYHLLSPASRGLFERVIMLSGSPLNSWAFREREKIIELSQDLMKQMNCGDVNCLREKPVADIMKATIKPYHFLSDHFIPTVDGTFLIEPPEVSVISGRFNRVKVLHGNSIDEGGDFLANANEDVMTREDGRVGRVDFLKVIKRARRGLTDLEARVLDALYTDWTDPDNPYMLRDAVRDIYSDGLLTCPDISFADGLAKAGVEVYRYVFDHKTLAQAMLSPRWAGATHASEQSILIGNTDFRFNETSEDLTVRKRLLKNVVDFIRTGDVNENLADDDLHWPVYKRSRKYKLIALSPAIGNNFRSQECARWGKLLPLVNSKRLC